MDHMKKVAADAVNEYFAGGKFKEVLDASINKAISESIHSAFSYSGAAKKQIEKAMGEAISLDFSQIEVPDFNALVVDFVKHKTINILEKQTHAVLARELEEMLSPAPAKITVQELVDMVKETAAENGDDDEYLTAEINLESNYGIDLKIWIGPKMKKSYLSSSETKATAEVNLYINRERKTISIIRNPDVKRNFGTSNFNNDAKIFLMYAAGTIITDILECDVDRLDLSLRSE